MTSWDGSERRNGNSRDHDLLIEISVDVKNFIKRLEEHEIEDKREFAEHTKQLRDLSRGYWIAVGAVLIIEFASRFFK